MELNHRTGLAWYAGLAVLILTVMALVSLLPHPATVQAQVISWPQPPYNPKNISFNSATAQTVVAAPTAGAVCVFALSLTNAGGTSVTYNVYLDGGTTSVGSGYLVAGGGNAYWPMLNAPKNPWFITNSTTGFVIQTSAASQINGSVYAATCP